MVYMILFIVALWYFGSWLSAYIITVNIPGLKQGRKFLPVVPLLPVLLWRSLLFDMDEPLKKRLQYSFFFLKMQNKYLLILSIIVHVYQESLAKHPQMSYEIERKARKEATHINPNRLILALNV